MTPTNRLAPGDEVLTTDTGTSDFGMPLVQPARTFVDAAVVRTVRNHCRVSGGTTVWFTDGTKAYVTARTGWLSR